MGKDLLKNFVDFIGMDTSGRNESKKIIVIIRIMIISYILYFTANMVVCNVVFEHLKVLLFYGSFLLLFIALFAMSYSYKTSVTLWSFCFSTIIWVVAIVHSFGWNIGVQHFLMVLLILYFFSGYKKYVHKIVFAVTICALRITLFYLYQDKVPVWKLSGLEESILQVLNTITIFWCISVIAFVFSKDSQELEGKLIEYNSQLQQQANTDTLTGLFNRRKAMDYMNAMVEKMSNDKGFCVCICDIDFFKKVNDNYGHDFGDLVLKKIAEIFREEMQGKNLAARWGGEEFLLLFPECNGDEAYVVIEQIRRRIKETAMQKDDLSIHVTMTFGLAEYDFFNGLGSTLKEADEKLYIGKEKGRDTIIF